MIKFGTDGWRAVISDEFTFENVRQVASAIADFLLTDQPNHKLIIIGYDARFLADRFAEIATKILEDAGLNCMLCERDTPTPVVAWEVKDRGAAGALMFTASHNPPQYCGIKFIPHYAGPATEEITKKIEENISKQTSSRLRPEGTQSEGATSVRGKAESPDVKSGQKAGKVERFEPRERYFKYIERFIDVEALKRAKLKIVVDPMYGSGRGYLDLLLQRFGCRTEEIHNYRDVLFGGQNPEPEETTLIDLKNQVKESGAYLGLALDGDADRFGVVDEVGDFYSANQVLALVFDYLVEDKGLGGSVVRSIATTHMLDAIAQKHKIKVHETPVGFKHIAQIMMREEVILGGEESGGFTIKGHIPEKDGILANLLVAEMVAKRGKPFSKIWEDLVTKIGNYESRRGKVQVPEEKKGQIMEVLKQPSFSSIRGVEIDEIKTFDGVKIILKDGSWMLVRPSGTEPLLRIYAESKNRGILDEMENFCYNLVGGA